MKCHFCLLCLASSVCVDVWPLLEATIVDAPRPLSVTERQDIKKTSKSHKAGTGLQTLALQQNIVQTPRSSF